MKKSLFHGLTPLLFGLTLFTSCDSGFTYKQDGNSLTVTVGNTNKRIQFLGDKIVRVTTTDSTGFTSKKSLIVINQNQNDFKVKENANELLVYTPSLKLSIDKKNANVEFESAEGKSVLKEKDYLINAADTIFKLCQRFSLDKDEAVYGMGEFQSGDMNYRGKELMLAQANEIAIVPFMVSSKNYGVLWDNYSKGLFKDSAEGLALKAECGNEIDYYFVLGDKMDDVVSGYRILTGKAPMFPKTAYGYWQSKERYTSFDELISVVKEYRKRQLPIDNIVQDWRYWGDMDKWCSMVFEKENYANPKENIKKLHNLNVKLMCSIWPAVGKNTELHADLEKMGGLLTKLDHWSTGNIVDVYNPKAMSIYMDYVYRGLLKNGVDALWFDGSEVEVDNTNTQEHTAEMLKKLEKNHLGSFSEYLNVFSLMATKKLYEEQRNKDLNKRVFTLTRSAFAGQQRFAAATWSGDVGATWETLRKQISAGLNFSIAGIPYWTHDIGGFFPGPDKGDYPKGVEENSYKELYTRWFQFGAFSPLFRSHGTGTPREIYRFGEKGGLFYDALEKSLVLRYKLIPYIYSCAWKVYADNYTLMRPLVMDFSETAVQNIDNAYMFGPSLLVKPVTHSMYYEKNHEEQITKKDLSETVYLPTNEGGWFDFWTNKHYEGGKKLTADYPIDIFPLFVKAGSILPVGEKMQYVDEKKNAPIELRIYAGNDAEFALYEDEGDNYNYEKNKYALVNVRWNESGKKLEIADRKGSFEGMPTTKEFKVVLIAGTEKPIQKVVKYSGKKLEISFE